MNAFVIVGEALSLLLVGLPFTFVYGIPWCVCRLSGHPISFLELTGIAIRGAKTAAVSDAFLIARRAGSAITTRELTDLYLASPAKFLDVVEDRIAKRAVSFAPGADPEAPPRISAVTLA